MEINYDIMADAVYFSVSKEKIDHTVKTNERFLVDVDARGNVVGFEILDVSSQQDLIQNLQENIKDGVPISVEDSVVSA